MFSGSYDRADVTFLLKPVHLEPTELAEKERLIQSGRRHYSEMIGHEQLPSPAYLRIFHEALERELARFAADVMTLALAIGEARPGPITLVSLARAGTPIGVLLGRALRQHLGRPALHYSLSIIRDRGIDETALRHVLERQPSASVVFVDGWTGKGIIASELRRVLTSFNARHGTQLDSGLYTVSDLCGAAACAASTDDYLIPSCILGATVSGLVSRSILNDTVVGAGDFHACLYYKELESHDLSRWFVDQVSEEMARQPMRPGSVPCAADLAEARRRSDAFLAGVRRRFGVGSVHYVKPGLGEATRVLLRRLPDCLLVRDPNQDQVAHLLVLAREKNVRTIVDPDLPYAAAAIIKELEG
jgi:hypothetical protein